MKVEKIILLSNESYKQLNKLKKQDYISSFAGKIASICSGKLGDIFDSDISDSDIRRGRRTLSEGYDNTPTKVWEFIPTFKFTDNRKYSNFRDLIKSNKVILNESSELLLKKNLDYYNSDDFFIFKCTAPRFIWKHVITHREISPLSNSARLSKFEYPIIELPTEVIESFNNSIYSKVFNIYKNMMFKIFRKPISIEHFLYKYVPEYYFNKFMKKFTKRKELYARPLSDFYIQEWLICGHSENFYNFFNERLKNPTQKETQEFVHMIKKLKNKNQLSIKSQ